MDPEKSVDEIFLGRISGIIMDNLSDDRFGADELVRKSGMSRYRLSTRIKKATGKNINQFIREIRLKKAFELLKSEGLTTSEIAYKTGFNSPAYFTKCFHDYFGYPPGQVKVRGGEKSAQEKSTSASVMNTCIYKYVIPGALVLAFLIIFLFNDDGFIEFSKPSGRPSVAVLPFENFTNRPELNYLGRAIQRDLISALSATGELEVRDEGSIDTLLSRTDALQNSLFPVEARNISKKLEAEFFITGSIQKFERQIRLDVHIVETKMSVVKNSVEAESRSDTEADLCSLIDTVRKRITESMLIAKIIRQNPYYQHLFNTPKSLEALRYYDNAFRSEDPGEDIRWLKLALKADSAFSRAALALEYAYSANNQPDSSYFWLVRNYSNRYLMEDKDRLNASWAYAFTFEPYDVQIRFLSELIKLDTEEPYTRYTLGLTYCLSGEYEKAIPELEKSYSILQRWGRAFLREPKNCRNFKWLGIAYHNTGRYRKERKLYREAEHYINEHPWYDLMQANLAFTENDSADALLHINNSRAKLRRNFDEAGAEAQIGRYFKDARNFDAAEDYYRRALVMSPDRLEILVLFADFCSVSNRHNDPDIMDHALSLAPNKQLYCEFLAEKGMCLHAQEKHPEAFSLIQEAWNEAPFKVYRIKHYLETVKKAAEDSRTTFRDSSYSIVEITGK